jgi:hypothetical protein
VVVVELEVLAASVAEVEVEVSAKRLVPYAPLLSWPARTDDATLGEATSGCDNSDEGTATLVE